jgi:hypothetical protein
MEDKSTAVLFIRVARSIQNPSPVQFVGEPIQWVETSRYLGATLDKQLTWSAHVKQVGTKEAQKLIVLGHLLNWKSGLSARQSVLLCKQLIRPMMDFPCLIWRSAANSHLRKLSVASVFALRLTHLGALVTGKFIRIWGFHSSPTSEH